MTLLETKFLPPPLIASAVDRPRLLDRLGSVETYRARLLVAPAGFGKTTLAQQWLQQQTVQYGWWTLDALDDSPSRFLDYFVACLERACQLDLPALPRPVPGPGGQEQTDLRGSLAALINAVELQVKTPVVLVLDDVHALRHPDVLEALSFWIDYAPSRVSLLMTSRRDLNLPLARWKVKRFALVLYAADLLFNREEIADWCRGRGEQAPSEQLVEQLQHRTSGWIAAMHLLLEGGSRGLAHLEAGTPEPRDRPLADRLSDISDYMAAEVLEDLDEDLRQFILEVHPLPRFDARLCDQIRRRHDSHLFIQQLVDRNLFIIPLDDRRQWYRLHELFQDAARLALTRMGRPAPDPIRLAEASMERHLLLEGLAMLVAGECWEALAHQLEVWGNELIRQGHHLSLADFLARLPEGLRRERPRLQLLTAWCQVMDNRFAALPALLDTLKQNLTGEKALPELLVEIQLLEAYVARQRQDFRAAIDLTQTLLEALDRSDAPLKSQAYFNLGTDLYRLGQLDDAEAMLRRAIHQGKIEQRFSTVLSSTGLLLWILQIRGQFIEALNFHRSILTWVASFHGDQDQPDIISCWLNSALVMIHVARGQLSLADSYLRPMLRFVDTAEPLQKILTRYVQAEWLRHAGRISEARDGLVEATAMLQGQPADVTTLTPPLHTALLKCQLDLGATTPVPTTEDSSVHPYARLEALAVEARRALTMGESNADAPITALREAAEWYRSPRHRCLAGIHETLLALLRGHPEQATERLRDALLLGESNDYVGMFKAFDEELSPLLGQVAPRTVSDAYWQHLTASEYSQASDSRRLPADASGRDPVAPSPAGDSVDLTAPPNATDTPADADIALDTEALSRRELEVLRLIEEGKPNKVIAQQLHLSPATVKAHLRNINAKLGASNRTEALALARRRGWLESGTDHS